MATSEGRSCNPDMPDRSCDFNKSLELYRFASAVALLGCGGVYLLGGALCFGLLKRGTTRCSPRLRGALRARTDPTAAFCVPMRRLRVIAGCGRARPLLMPLMRAARSPEQPRADEVPGGGGPGGAGEEARGAAWLAGPQRLANRPLGRASTRSFALLRHCKSRRCDVKQSNRLSSGRLERRGHR